MWRIWGKNQVPKFLLPFLLLTLRRSSYWLAEDNPSHFLERYDGRDSPLDWPLQPHLPHYPPCVPEGQCSSLQLIPSLIKFSVSGTSYLGVRPFRKSSHIRSYFMQFLVFLWGYSRNRVKNIAALWRISFLLGVQWHFFLICDDGLMILCRSCTNKCWLQYSRITNYFCNCDSPTFFKLSFFVLWFASEIHTSHYNMNQAQIV